MLDELHSLAETLEYTKLMERVKNIKTGLPKERIPMPKKVPNYILEHLDWIKAPTLDMSNENLVRQILGSDSTDQ
jgi:hypothetical protein